jgi:hypothetical protein
MDALALSPLTPLLWGVLASFLLLLYPGSLVFTFLLTREWPVWLRISLLVLWPLVGVAFLSVSSAGWSRAVPVWALASSAFYALRLLTVRELHRWVAFFACSALALAAAGGAPLSAAQGTVYALALTLPLALLAWLADVLGRRYGAAYAGVPAGVAAVLPRWSGVLIFALLATIATPPFPSFFVMLDLLTRLTLLGQCVGLTIWLLWTWSAVRLFEGFLSGKAAGTAGITVDGDLGRGALSVASVLLALGVLSGLYLAGQAG